MERNESATHARGGENVPFPVSKAGNGMSGSTNLKDLKERTQTFEDFSEHDPVIPNLGVPDSHYVYKK